MCLDRFWPDWCELKSQGHREHDGDQRIVRIEHSYVSYSMRRRVASEVIWRRATRTWPPLYERAVKWTQGEIWSRVPERDLPKVATS